VTAELSFQKGWFEVQDEGSQIVADLVLPQDGEQVLDYCAGGGGKTLAMSAAMHNKGQVHAYDADRKRLAPIIERLKRAGTRNVQVHDNPKALKNLDERTAQQQDALSQASAYVRPGGELIYVTCSVLPQENEQQVRAFTAANPAFEISGALEGWDQLFGKDSPHPRSSDGQTITLTPASTDTDGFFFCRMKRKS
jgi:16S rRNA (cytosine967-C5)-methyltransferase